jgi:flagellar biosynthetic protein FlhB
MAEAAAQEKTEKATPRRRQDARKKGQVAQSKEISSVLILMTIMGIFYFAGSWTFYNLSGIFTGIYGNIGTLSLNNATEADFFLHMVFEYLISILIPIFLPIVVAAVVANIAQVGFEMHGQPLQPKLSKLNPISGMKKIVSLKSMVELVKSMFKIVIVGGVAYVIVEKEMHYFPSLMQQSVVDILLFIASVTFKIFFFVCLVLIFLAVLDYVYQRWQHEKSLKMTKQEIKDERKQTEGDPKIKARIRSIQLEMAQRRMMEAIPEADVVITNPTHLALAIKFDAKEMIAPTVLAKGSGFIAERIKEVAREHNVPIIEDKPLAQAMFKLVEIGDFIPIELYRAVAEVLAYVYRLKGQYAGA